MEYLWCICATLLAFEKRAHDGEQDDDDDDGEGGGQKVMVPPIT